MALTAAEQAEMAQLQKEVGGQGAGGGLSPQEQAEMEQLQKEVGHLAPEPMAAQPGLLSSLASGALNLGGRAVRAVGRTVDKYSDAPTRTAIMAAQKGENPFSAFANQFGEDPEKAPTGKDIAAKAGVSTNETLSMPAAQRQAFDEKYNPGLAAAMKAAHAPYEDLVSPSPAAVAGAGVDIAASPLNAIPLIGKAPLVGEAMHAGLLKPASEALKNVAETRAFKALGPVKGFQDAAETRGLVNSIGRTALDEGVVSPLASKRTMLSRAEDLESKKGAELQDLIDAVSKGEGLSPEQASQVNASRFNPAEAGNKLKSDLRAEYSELPEEATAPRANQIDSFLKADEPLDIQRAQNLKKQIGKFIKDRSYWQNNPGASQEGLVNIRKAVKEGIEKNADAYAGALGEEGGAIKDTNRQLGNASEMQDILRDRISRNDANRTVGLLNLLKTSIAEHALGKMGLLAAPVNMFLDSKGSQLMATGADKLSKGLAVPGALNALPEGRAALGLVNGGTEVLPKAAERKKQKGFLNAQ